MSWLESILRGAGQGATLGWGDELGSKLVPEVDDGTNIPREYAAGSAEQDLLQKLRRDNATAAAENPALYAGGAVAGALPSALATPFGVGGAAAGRLAATSLLGGALGGLSGSGLAEDGAKLRGAGEGALAGAMTGMAGAAAAESLPLLRRAAQGLRAVAPVTAGAPASAGGAQINQTHAIPPPRRTSGTWDMPSIPKAGKKPISESMIPASDDLAEAADVVHGQKMLGQEMNPTDVEKFVGLRDKVKAGNKPKEEFAPEAESAVMPKTVRPPRKKARGPEKGPAVQQELPGVDRNQRSGADLQNAKRRFQDANSLLKDAGPEKVDALKRWVHESRSGASPELDSLPAGDYGVGYRGLKLSPEELNAALKKGEIPHEQMSSWSVNPDTAKAFGTTILRQTNTRGVPVGRNEGEVLVPPQGSLRVDQFSRDPEGFLNVDVSPKRAPAAASEAERQLLDQLSLFE